MMVNVNVGIRNNLTTLGNGLIEWEIVLVIPLDMFFDQGFLKQSLWHSAFNLPPPNTPYQLQVALSAKESLP